MIPERSVTLWVRAPTPDMKEIEGNKVAMKGEAYNKNSLGERTI